MIFRSAADDLHDNLRSIAELDAAMAASSERPQVLYKHSTRCNVCRYSLAEVRDAEGDEPDTAGWHVLDLLAHREVSDAIAERTGVRHKSPQVIVVRNGDVIAHASHGDITAAWIRDAVRSAG